MNCKWTIRKRFQFSASHSIPSLPADHKCARLHGHNYIVEIELGGAEVDEHGFVRDFGMLSDLKTYIDDNMDHRHLNDLLDSTSAEMIAKHLLEWCTGQWPETTAVRVYETPNCWAECRSV